MNLLLPQKTENMFVISQGQWQFSLGLFSVIFAITQMLYNYQFRYTNNNAAVCWLIITADAPFTQLSRTNGQAYLNIIK